MEARKVIPIVILLAVIVPPVGSQTTQQTPDVLARIGDFNVIPSYIDYVVENHFARDVINHIIRRQVIVQKAHKEGIKVSHDRVTEVIENRKADADSEEAFLASVRQQGLTMKGYRRQVQTQLLLDKLMASATEISQQEIEAYYEKKHDKPWPTQLQMRLLHVFTGDREDAISAYRALLDGTPFSVIARRFNAENAPAEDGDLGWQSKDTIPIEGLWTFARGLQTGHTSKPFKLNDHYHIIKLRDKRRRPAPGNEKLKKQITAELRKHRQPDPEKFVNDLMADADITLKWEPVAYLSEKYSAPPEG